MNKETLLFFGSMEPRIECLCKAIIKLFSNCKQTLDSRLQTKNQPRERENNGKNLANVLNIWQLLPFSK